MNRHKIIVKIEFYDAKDLEAIQEISEVEWNLSKPEFRPYLMMDKLVKIINTIMSKLYPESNERVIVSNKNDRVFRVTGEEK